MNYHGKWIHTNTHTHSLTPFFPCPFYYIYAKQLGHITNDEEPCKMANLIRRPFTKKKDHTSVVGRVKPNGRCKKHPKHQQSPGVCSLCLREKLSQISAYAISRRKRTTSFCSSGSSSASSLSSYDSLSSASSSCASPTHRFTRSGSSVPIFLLSGKHGIMRSRSMAVVPRRIDREGGVVHHGYRDNSASKSGFWFKLLHPKRKIVKDERDTKLLRYKRNGHHN